MHILINITVEYLYLHNQEVSLPQNLIFKTYISIHHYQYILADPHILLVDIVLFQSSDFLLNSMYAVLESYFINIIQYSLHEIHLY